MTENNDRINLLIEKLEDLVKRQYDVSREINKLREEIFSLKTSQDIETFIEKEIKIEKPETTIITSIHQENDPVPRTTNPVKAIQPQPKYAARKAITTPKIKTDIEKFIGENIISKIGIVITIIGVAIGAKYSIEHQLISPLTRIILGYLIGLTLMGFGIKLKKNYENFSAALVSGAISILYFITFAAYSFYGLIPQLFAFILMVVFTLFAVVAAINYNKQVIAHIGLVGAYAVPFLLSNGSNKVAVLFTYMAIINIGILLIALKKYWKPLYYSSFVLTWLIFYSWYSTDYLAEKHYGLALIFLSIFFVTFYIIFLAYKLIQKEKFESEDVILLLSNSFIFYGIGYSILGSRASGEELLGLFTLENALIHFVVSAIIYKKKLADKNLLYLITGLVLTFITIAIPVQLDGNWVTLLWVGEAALLFWIGRIKNIPVYEKLSYALIFLAFFSIIQDWLTLYNNYYPEQQGTRLTPLFNINFLSSLLFIAAFSFINYLNNKRILFSPLFKQKIVSFIITYSIPSILLIALYYSFMLEISNYWNQLETATALHVGKEGGQYFFNYDLNYFKTIWVLNYSLLFFSILSFVNLYKIKNRTLGFINLGFSILVIAIFLTQGLFTLSELRESYLNRELSPYFHGTYFNILIRYISYAFVGLMLFSIYRHIKNEFLKPVGLNLIIAFDVLFFTTILWIASSELITWMNIMRFPQSYKLGLSILWGTYALFLIALGIWKKKKHLRIGAIALFAATLIKLFFYDIAHLDTIAKTIVFVSLGVLLLIISFLYNKYKHLIADEIKD
ncbi:MAG: DUF2339 domain-containing protein [Ginsengibacter sp.]